MINLKTDEDIKRLRESGIILARTLQEVEKYVAPGITTKELDKIAENFIRKNGATPAFLGYQDYPGTLCISVNDEVIHGIPGKRKLREGDIVGIDLGVTLKRYISDACKTFAVGKITKERQQLMKVTEESLYLAIEQAVPGKRLHDIGRAVHGHAKKYGYDVVREFCGHGVGFDVHEDPQVPNYVGKGRNLRLKPGMVLAIEPMVNVGTHKVEILEDDWTVVTVDGKDSCHFEHTVAVTKEGNQILTNLPGA